MNELSQADIPSAGTTVSERLKSLDAYRGLIMITLAFGVLGITHILSILLFWQWK